MEHQQSGSCYHHGLFKFCQGQELQHNEVFRPKSRKRFPGRSRNGPRSSYQVQQKCRCSFVHLLTAKMPTLSWMMFVKFHTEDPVLELVRPCNTLLKTFSRQETV